MTGALGLSPVQTAHYLLHNALTFHGAFAQKPVRVRPEGDHFVVTTGGTRVHVPSALRWRMYRRGWQKRLDRLAWQFGVDDVAGLRPGEHVIDIGANVGEFALACATRGARVECIEGDPGVFACLSRNIAGQGAITAHQGVVWHSEEELTFYSAPAQADSSIIADPSDPRYRAIKVQAVPLDKLAAAGGWGQFALLKCDAEGAEPEVLQGAAAVLARCRAVAIDTGPERLGQETHAPVAEILTAAGFTVTRETRAGRKITFGRRA